MSAPAAPELSATLAEREGVELRHLCDMSIDLDVQPLPSPAGNRMHFALVRGVCHGERLNGTFRSNGGDWLTFGSDRIGRVDVRATLETDDCELVYMTNTGRIVLSEEALGRLGTGERIAWDEMYARSSPLFETGSEKYAWLNGVATVAINEIALDHVDYRIFEVL